MYYLVTQEKTPAPTPTAFTTGRQGRTFDPNFWIAKVPQLWTETVDDKSGRQTRRLLPHEASWNTTNQRPLNARSLVTHDKKVECTHRTIDTSED